MKDHLLIAALLISLYTDLKQGKIYNWITLGLTCFALIYHLMTGGIGAMLHSLQGLLVGTALFFIPFLLGGLGGGDIKLFGAIGAMQGAAFAVKAAVLTGIIGGLVAIVVLLSRKALLPTIQGLWLDLLRMLFRVQVRDFDLEAKSKASIYRISFPYGVPIVCGTLLAYLI